MGIAYQRVKMLGKRANPFTIPQGQEAGPRQMPSVSEPQTVSAANQSCHASKTLLFLYNNLHAVYRAKPTVPWCKPPKLCCANRERFLAANDWGLTKKG